MGLRQWPKNILHNDPYKFMAYISGQAVKTNSRMPLEKQLIRGYAVCRIICDI